MKNRIITSEQTENFYRYLCSEERTENTVTKYLRDIAAFREWNGEQAVTKDRVIAYKQHLSDTGYKVRRRGQRWLVLYSCYLILYKP